MVRQTPSWKERSQDVVSRGANSAAPVKVAKEQANRSLSRANAHIRRALIRGLPDGRFQGEGNATCGCSSESILHDHISLSFDGDRS